MKTDIIIIHYGKIEQTKKCIKSLQERRDDFQKIIVVNNDPSTDIKNIGKSNTVVKLNSTKNLGFAKAVNKGLLYTKKDKADAVLLINNDAALAKGSITSLTKLLSENVGIVAPVIMYEKDGKKMYDHGGYISPLTGKTMHDEREKVSKKKISPHYVSGCCMAISKKTLEKVGDLDTQFFMYFEDVDYCIRAKDNGYDIQVTPDVIVKHNLAGKKSKDTLTHIITSNRKFHDKYRARFPLGWTQPIKDTLVFSLKDTKNIQHYIQTLVK